MFELLTCRIYKKELEDAGTPNVEKTLEKQFSSWFKKHVSFMPIFLFEPYQLCWFSA